MKNGFAQASLSMVREAITGNRNTTLRRIAGTGVHDMGVDFAFRPEKLFVTPGGGHRLIFEDNLGLGLALVQGIRIRRASPGLRRGRAQSVNAASRAGNQSRVRYLSVSKYPPCDPPHNLSDAAGVEFDSLRSNNTVCASGSRWIFR